MKIEKELIHKAKEKLGDKNATIMADLLSLKEFDERNLKALCPYHDEDTPSFIYNRKNFSFHCFGCQKTVDILDVLMEQGKTFVEAVDFLFQRAEINYSFGEHKVRTKADYKYPTEEEINEKSKVCEYLSKRGISKQTIDLLDIREDKNGNCVFNFYDTNDVLTMVKYRPARTIDKSKKESKCWCQKGADTFPLLFNMNRVNTEKPLLICEGEIDCASAIESGFSNTVSIPLGAGNTHWIEENWEWLNQFDSIIIWSDNDEAGIKMRKECLYRLGSWRTKYISTPEYYVEDDGRRIKTKDINDCLQVGGAAYVLNLIIHAQESPIDSVVNFSDIKEIDLSEIDGIYSGIHEFDEEMMRLFYGTFNIVSGVNGSGKSSFLSQLICQALDQGKDCWLYSRELPNYMSKNWINFILAGNRNIISGTTGRGSKYYLVNDEAKQKIDSFYSNRLFIYKDGYENTLPAIQHSMEDCARKYGSKLFIIDNLTAINFKCSDDAKWGKQVDFINFLIDFAQKFHVVTILVIHPKKLETMRRMTKFDVQGLGSIVDLAHRLFTLYRVTPADKRGVPKNSGKGWLKEPIKYDVMLDVLKDRLRGKENLSIGLYYDVPSRRFYTNEKEYDFQYKWDDTKYTTPSGYVDRDADDEFPGYQNE